MVTCKESLGSVNSAGKRFLEELQLDDQNQWFEFEENTSTKYGIILTWIAYRCWFEDYSKIDQGAFVNADGIVTD